MGRFRKIMSNQEKRNARALLASIAGEAMQGSMRLVCPFCHGGNSQETSLVLTIRGDGTFYCCHRAACGESGTLNKPMLPNSLGAVVQQNRPKRFDLPYRHAEGDDVWTYRFAEALDMSVSLATVTQAGLFVAEDDPEEAVWVLRGFDGELRGYQTRKNWQYGGKRVRTFKEVDGYMYHVIPPLLRGVDHNCLVVVEDAMSAAAVASHGYHSLALLGTYLPEEVADEAGTRGYEAITIALDPGAEKEAKRAYDTMLSANRGQTFCTYIPKDFKNMDGQTRQDVLNYVFGGL